MSAIKTEGPEAEAAPRQTLAMRLAERNRQRALRAERLAKLRTLGPEAASEAIAGIVPEAIPETQAAMLPEAIVAAEPAAEPVVELAPELAPELTAELAADPVIEPAPRETPADAPVAEVVAGPGPARDREADAALADFLRALTGGVPPTPAPLPAEPGAILHFQRPADRPDPETAAPPATSGLEQLPGAGPGLVWALGRAGLDSLAAIAPLAPAELADRLGPIGRLVPAERWVATARAAGEAAAQTGAQTAADAAPV